VTGEELRSAVESVTRKRACAQYIRFMATNGLQRCNDGWAVYGSDGCRIGVELDADQLRRYAIERGRTYRMKEAATTDRCACQSLQTLGKCESCTIKSQVKNPLPM